MLLRIASCNPVVLRKKVSSFLLPYIDLKRKALIIVAFSTLILRLNFMDQFISFFISSAYADTAAGAGANAQNGGLSIAMMLAIFFAFLYFGIWRPQNKRAKEQQNLMSSLTKGDEVVTAGGLLGRITKIHDQYLVLTLTTNTDVVMQKSSIVSILPKGTIKTLE